MTGKADHGSRLYDDNGNVTAFGTDTFGYISENLLTSASVGGASTTLSYDPLMRLHQTVEPAPAEAGGGTTSRFAYDGLDMIAEYNGSNALQRRYVHGPGMDEPLVQYEGSGTSDRRFLHADERGSIVAVSNASGAMLNINKYDEFGTPGASNVGRFQYTGQMWLSEIGVQYSKARMYDPGKGRFLQTDPIGYAGGINLYAYVGNDPINFVDPLGLCDQNKSTETTSDDCEIVVTGKKLKKKGEGGSATDIVVVGTRTAATVSYTIQYVPSTVSYAGRVVAWTPDVVGAAAKAERPPPPPQPPRYERGTIDTRQESWERAIREQASEAQSKIDLFFELFGEMFRILGN